MKMKSTRSLPDGYSEVLSIDMSENRRSFITVNVISLVIAVAMLVPFMIYLVTNIASADYKTLLIDAALIIAGSVVYTVLHELTHALFIIFFGCKRPSFGFKGFFAYTRADFYFSKFAYTVIALAPVVILGIILGVLTAVLRDSLFPVFYLISVINLSGAAGDFYVIARILPLPRDILVYDTGTAMRVYSQNI